MRTSIWCRFVSVRVCVCLLFVPPFSLLVIFFVRTSVHPYILYVGLYQLSFYQSICCPFLVLDHVFADIIAS